MLCHTQGVGVCVHTPGVGVCVVLHIGCRYMRGVVHWVWVYVWCCTLGVGVCAVLYTGCRYMCCDTLCMCMLLYNVMG